MNEVVAYKCIHCGKISERKGYIKQHEKKCYHNPETRSCASCKYLIFGYKENPITGIYEPFQTCRKEQEIKFKQLKTNCFCHKPRPGGYDEIEYIRSFQGPYYLQAEQFSIMLN